MQWVGICISHIPLLHVQEPTGQMQVPIIPNDYTCENAIVDQVIISNTKCVVIDRHEV